MSASNWAICPRCNQNNVRLMSARKEQARENYGKVSAEEYSELLTLAQDKIATDSNLREDYEQGVTPEGEYYVRYSGACLACGFSFRHEYRERVLK